MDILELIADPVRLDIVRHLAPGRAASLTELAEAAGVHVNTARSHVAALEDAGALEARRREHEGPGRPGIEYALRESWSVSLEQFRGVAELLASALLRAGATSEELAAVGRDWGRFVVGRPGRHDAEQEVLSALQRLGYVATIEGRELRVSGCPCPLISPDQPELVCDLAAGVVEGALAGSASELRVVKRENNPAARSCCMTLND